MEWIGGTVCKIFAFKLHCDLETGVRGSDGRFGKKEKRKKKTPGVKRKTSRYYRTCGLNSNFRPICGYISERVLDRGIVSMEDEYEVICALSNIATFDDLE